MLYPEDYEDAAPPPSRFWGWTLFAWLLFIAIIVLGFVKCAQAAEVYRVEDPPGKVRMSLRLSEEPCTHARVRAALYAKLLDDRRFKAAVLFYAGRDWASCWADVDGVVLSMDEEGAPLQPLPRREFKDDAL